MDFYGLRRLTSVLEWMGAHALSIFVLITSNLAIIVIQGFYWRHPENNIVSIDSQLLFFQKSTSPNISQYSFLVCFSPMADSLDHNMFCAQVTWLLKLSMQEFSKQVSLIQ